ncbi:MAG TPA: hypothetical protein VFP22_11740 [Candidatus Limnocylindrales bacterium]|nr:hypothetical protein [Candidatus Limnocylindrales bacterium]
MDPPSLFVALAIVAAIVVFPRLVAAAGQTSDVIAQLFVPPDRALGWPHGVQEGDDPWGWREVLAPDPEPPADEGGSPLIVEVVDADSSLGASLTVEVGPVVRSNRRAA